MQREPRWACPNYEAHGERAACDMCLERFREQGDSSSADLPPPGEFGRGWFSVGAAHWFEATDATVYVARDGQRVLAQAACGEICDVTTARARQGEHECRACLRALDKARPVFPRGQGGGSSLRVYRGLKEPYDPTRMGTDRLSCSNFTDSAFLALQYASARRGVVWLWTSRLTRSVCPRNSGSNEARSGTAYGGASTNTSSLRFRRKS